MMIFKFCEEKYISATEFALGVFIMDELKAKERLSRLVSPEVLADVTRIRIMKALSIEDRPCGELFNKYPNGKRHMEILEKEGIVKKTAKGFYTFFSLAKPEIKDALADL